MAELGVIKLLRLGDSTDVQRFALVDAAGDQILEFGGGDPATGGAILTPIPANASSVELLPADPTRVEAFIRNNGTGILYIAEGADATANSAIKLLQDDVFRVTSDLVVNGIWVGVNGNAAINEKTM